MSTPCARVRGGGMPVAVAALLNDALAHISTAITTTTITRHTQHSCNTPAAVAGRVARALEVALLEDASTRAALVEALGFAVEEVRAVRRVRVRGVRMQACATHGARMHAHGECMRAVFAHFCRSCCVRRPLAAGWSVVDVQGGRDRWGCDPLTALD